MPIGGGAGGANASGIRAGRAYITVSLQGVSAVASGLTTIRNLVGSVGSLAAKSGLTIAGLGGAGGLFTKLGLDKIQDLSKQGAIAQSLGLTAEQFTGIAGVARAAGEDTKEFIESLVTLGKITSEAAIGTAPQSVQFFKDINLNAAEFKKLRADEQFFKFFEAVQLIADPLTRVRALMTAFGEDGGKLLLPLLAKAPGELRSLAAGFSSTAEEVQAAQAAQLSYATATAQLERVWRSVVVGLAPVVERAAGAFSRAVAPVAAFVGQNKELVVAGIAVAGGVAGAVAAVIALAPAVAGVVAAIGPLNVALVALAAYALKGTEAGDALASVWGDAFGGIGGAAGEAMAGLREDFARTWQGLSNALKSGDIARAAEIGFAAIEVAWARTLKMLREQWERFKFALSESKEAAVDQTAQGINSTTGNVKAFAAILLSNLPQWAGGPDNPQRMVNEVLQKIQAEENKVAKALNEGAKVAAQNRKAEFEDQLVKKLEADTERIENANRRLQAAIAGGGVGPGVLALGGGALAGIGTPGAAAQGVADFFEKFFPKRGEGSALLAAVGGLGAIPAPIAAKLLAGADAGTAAARGIFGGGRGDLSGAFGGGSPIVRVAKGVEELVKTAKDVSKKFEDTNRKLDELGGEFA